MHYYIPFPRGQGCKAGIPPGAVSMRLPAGFSGMRLWEKAAWEAGYQKADFAF